MGEKTLAAVEYQWYQVKGTLMRSRRALKGWRKEVPPKSRLPLPRTVAFGIAMGMLSLQQKPMALMVLLSFDTYLRPGEAHALKVKNLVPPVRGSGRQYQQYVVVVRDEDDGVPDKTGVFNNSLPLDHPLTSTWLGKALSKLKAHKREDQLLFAVDGIEYRKAFEAAGGWWIARAAHLPASSWRCCRRLAVQDQGVRGREGSGAVEDGLVGSPLRQGGESADTAEPLAPGLGLLPSFGGRNGSRAGAKNPLSR